MKIWFLIRILAAIFHLPRQVGKWRFPWKKDERGADMAAPAQPPISGMDD